MSDMFKKEVEEKYKSHKIWGILSQSMTHTGACRTYFPRPQTRCIDPRSILRDQNKGLIRQPELGHKHQMLASDVRSEEHTSELQSHSDLVCRLLLEKKKNPDNSSVVRSYQSPKEVVH